MGFESNQLPANAPIEDRRSAATCLQTRGMLLGVFDGHAGCACAQVKITLMQFVFVLVARSNSGPEMSCSRFPLEIHIFVFILLMINIFPGYF